MSWSCDAAGANCVPPPCALPLAVRVQVTSSVTGLAVDSVTIQQTGPFGGAATPCPSSVCYAVGGAGTYSLTISAPGFQPSHLDVVVTGKSGGKCGCDTVNQEQRSVALVPIAMPG